MALLWTLATLGVWKGAMRKKKKEKIPVKVMVATTALTFGTLILAYRLLFSA